MGEAGETSGPLRLAIAGARRGRSFGPALAALADRITVTALCDSSPDALRLWVDDWGPAHRWPRGFASFDRLLGEAECDAVFLATPMTVHAPQAVAALAAGKHVLSEVIAAGCNQLSRMAVRGKEMAGSLRV